MRMIDNMANLTFICVFAILSKKIVDFGSHSPIIKNIRCIPIAPENPDNVRSMIMYFKLRILYHRIISNIRIVAYP